MKVSRTRLIAALVAAPLLLTGCSAGSLGSASDDGSGGGSTSISILTTDGPGGVGVMEKLADAFEKKNPDITVKVETRPGGGDGDNLIKTRLSTGSMNDLFTYNSGSLFQQLDPAKNLQPLTSESFESNVEDSYKPNVTVGSDVYAVPFGTNFGGGILYNIPLYKKLGLSVPTTWDEFIANSQKIKAAGGGVAPVVQTYGDTWTSQLLVLADFHNVAAAEPNFAEDYTNNKAKYATDEYASAGFEHLQQLHDLGLVNSDYASAKEADGLKMVAEGTGAQYPMLSAVVNDVRTAAPNNVDDIGFFALPGQDASTNGLTSWAPEGMYLPKSTSGAKLAAAKKFLEFMTTSDACDTQFQANTPTGPIPVKGCQLPSEVPQLTKDVSAYFESGKQSPALEYLSPVKGPNLEQITVQVGSGISTAAEGAELYDQDVEKQAQQLGLAGW